MNSKIVFCSILFSSIFSFSQNNIKYNINKDSLDTIVDTLMEEEDIPGLAIGVIVNDELINFYTYGYGDIETKTVIDKNTGFQIGSVTKPIVASLVMKMYAEGKIDINKPIKTYLPEMKFPESAIPITLAHLLSHSSGLPKDAINRVDIPNTPTVRTPYSKEDLYNGMMGTDLLFTPGTSYEYSSLGYALIGHIIEVIADQTLEDLLKKEILDQIGMSSTYAQKKQKHMIEASQYWPKDKPKVERKKAINGEIWGHAGITSTMNDLAKFVSLQFKRSHLNFSIIPPEYLILSHTPRIPTFRDFEAFVGLGWFVNKTKAGINLSHSGDDNGHSSYISFLPQEGVGFIVLTNVGGASSEVAEEIIDVIYYDMSKMKKEMGLAFYNQDWDELATITKKMLQLNPNNSRAQYFLGKALYKIGMYDNSVEHLKIAILDKMYSGFAYYYLASISASKNNDDMALDYLTKSVNLGFIDGDELLSDKNLKKLSTHSIYKKLARWGHPEGDH